MRSHTQPGPSCPSQADWLAELAAALAQCDKLLAELREEHPPGIDATILAARVATMRSEIAKLERGLAEGAETMPPEWTHLFAEAGQTPWAKSPPPPNSTI